MVEGGLVAGEAGRATETAEPIDVTFERLSDRAIDRCYSLAGYLLGNAEEAEDATQDAMARAWRSRESLRDPALFDAWLDRILVNTCMDRMRRRRIVRFVDIEAGGELPAADPFKTFLAGDEVARAVAGLKPELRVVVVLRFWRDLPVDAIAERLGCPAGTVKSRLHAAIGALRESLERDAEEEPR